MRYPLVLATLTVTTSLLLAPRNAPAQSRWSVEVSGDAVFPTGTLAGADLEKGGGFGTNVRFLFRPHLAAYAGWEWHLQQTKDLLPGGTLDVNETGYAFGLRFEHPFRSEQPSGTALGYWLRAGGLFNHIELENESGALIDDTGHGLGWEAGAGLTIPLGGRLGLTPGARYRVLSPDITVGGRAREATLSYVTAFVGLAYNF